MAEEEIENERVNLLVCKTYKTIEEVPYTKTGKYLGEGKYDQSDNPFLEPIVAPHERGGHMGILTDVNFVYWMTPSVKASIIAQVKEQFTGKTSPLMAGLDALGTNFYDTKDTYSQDAMRCWQLHNRTKDCGEYKSDRKLLSAGTEKDRKAEGLAKSTIKVYLCDFCPVKMARQAKAVKARGLDK